MNCGDGLLEYGLRGELENFANHDLVFSGDTLSHATARKLVRLGLAMQRDDGFYQITAAGRLEWNAVKHMPNGNGPGPRPDRAGT